MLLMLWNRIGVCLGAVLYVCDTNNLKTKVKLKSIYVNIKQRERNETKRKKQNKLVRIITSCLISLQGVYMIDIVPTPITHYRLCTLK